jgi:hypothetical protein
MSGKHTWRKRRNREKDASGQAKPFDLFGHGFVEVLPGGFPGPDWMPAEDQGEPTTLFGMPVVFVVPPKD